MLSPIPQYSSSSVAQARSSIREDRVQGSVTWVKAALLPVVESFLILLAASFHSDHREVRTETNKGQHKQSIGRSRAATQTAWLFIFRPEEEDSRSYSGY
ncbi:unnamed protein product [Arabidopsis halleri]